MDKKLLTLVVPSYNEEEAIPLFYEEALRVEKELTDIDIEYLFVDDGSRDETMRVVKELNARDPRVHYVSFSRNFGKEAAIYAGLENAAGDYVAILDADLQDPPSLLPEMLEAVEKEGYDCVGSRRVTRKGEPPIRSFFARCFYKLMGKISSSEVVDGARDFQLMNRKVVNAILAMGEYNRFSKGIFGWVGFKKKWLEYENVERAAGETKWSFWKLFVYALDGIVAFSTAPLVIASFMGMLFCLIAFIAIIFIIIKTVIFGDPTSGWPSMVCIIMMVSGIQLLCIGILGQYLAKTYLETKKRPLYLVEEAVLAKDKDIK
ncbi:MAG: glycosyltransferase family 2 protein [Lachnospiraceae bacterium]|nr:glycosyltransferase family 2 protein [Lachnospiraceae bacterium]MBR1573206.1 glycosyltransferase family 2 protein [Lachnospiraceae bacterium]